MGGIVTIGRTWDHKTHEHQELDKKAISSIERSEQGQKEPGQALGMKGWCDKTADERLFTGRPASFQGTALKEWLYWFRFRVGQRFKKKGRRLNQTLINIILVLLISPSFMRQRMGIWRF